jgi:hypothetical protein
VRLQSAFILLYPSVKIAPVKMNPAPFSYDGQVPLKNEVLDGLLRPTQVNSGLLYIE